MKKILKSKIFALTFLILINISVTAKVEASEYVEDGKKIKCIVDGTGINANREFCLTYDQKDSKGNNIAKITNQSASGTYTYEKYFSENKPVKRTVINLMPEEYQQQMYPDFMYKQLLILHPDYLIDKSYSRTLSYKFNDYYFIREQNKVIVQFARKEKRITGERINFDDDVNSSKSISNIYMFSNENVILGIDFDGNIQPLNADNIPQNLLTGYLWQPLHADAYLWNAIAYSDLKIYAYNSNYDNLDVVQEWEHQRNVTYKYKLTDNENMKKDFSILFDGLEKDDKINIDIKYSDTNENIYNFNENVNSNLPTYKFIYYDLEDSAVIDILIKDKNNKTIKSECIKLKIDYFESLNDETNTANIFNIIKKFLNKAVTIVAPLFSLLSFAFNKLDVFMQFGIVSVFIVFIIYFLMRRLR